MSVTCAYTYAELISYSDAETVRWREWFTRNPGALDVPFAEGRLATIRGLVLHIFSVELRYTDRLCGREATPYDDIHADSLEEIFALGDRARSELRGYLATMTEADAAVVLTFSTLTAGTLTASKRKIASNIFIHGMRHWAQVATTLRSAGFTDQWGHDILLSELAM
jgi:uncharacterized damage-inducible protein DinB